ARLAHGTFGLSAGSRPHLRLGAISPGEVARPRFGPRLSQTTSRRDAAARAAGFSRSPPDHRARRRSDAGGDEIEGGPDRPKRSGTRSAGAWPLSDCAALIRPPPLT